LKTRVAVIIQGFVAGSHDDQLTIFGKLFVAKNWRLEKSTASGYDCLYQATHTLAV
jgi:hypothetical protein